MWEWKERRRQWGSEKDVNSGECLGPSDSGYYYLAEYT